MKTLPHNFWTEFGNSGDSAARKWPIYFVTSFSRKVVSWGIENFFSRLKTSPDLIWKLFIPQRKHLGGFKLTIWYSGVASILGIWSANWLISGFLKRPQFFLNVPLIFSNFVAFSQCLNFTGLSDSKVCLNYQGHCKVWKSGGGMGGL